MCDITTAILATAAALLIAVYFGCKWLKELTDHLRIERTVRRFAR